VLQEMDNSCTCSALALCHLHTCVVALDHAAPRRLRTAHFRHCKEGLGSFLAYLKDYLDVQRTEIRMR